jgi:ribosomal protein L20
MAYSGSASDRLNAVRAAIDACLTSQQYTVRGRSQQMAQLRDLRQLEKELMEETNQEAQGSAMASLGLQIRPR